MSVTDASWPHSPPTDPPSNGKSKSKRSWDPTEGRVAQVAKRKLWGKVIGLAPFVFIAAILASPFILVAKIFDRVMGRENLRSELKTQFNRDLLKHLQQVPYPKSKPDRETRNYRELYTFAIGVKRLKADLYKYNADSLREEIARLSQWPIYRHYRNYPGDRIPAPVAYLQDLAVALESMNGTNAFREYGKRRLKGKNSSNFSGFSADLLATQNEMTNTRNNWFDRIVWGAKNPLKALKGLESHLFPLDVNPYVSQPVFQIPLPREGQSIDLKFSPTLTGPQSMVELLLIPAYRRKGRRWVHVDYQSTHKGPERMRIDQVHEWAKKNEGVFLHAILSTNTPAVIAKKEVGPQCSIDEYKRVICGDDWSFVRDDKNNRGIYIPFELLNDAELEAAFNAAQEISQGVQDLQTMDRLIKAAFLWAIMDKERREHEGSTLSAGCRETIDRGPFDNLLLFVMDRRAQGAADMGEEDREVWTGVTLGKGDFSMNRGPEEKRPLQFKRVTEALQPKQVPAGLSE